MAMTDILPMRLEHFRNKLRKTTSHRRKPLTQATIQHYLVLIRQIYNRLTKLGHYDGKNPATQLEYRQLNNEITEILTSEQAHNLVRVLSTSENRNLANLVLLAYYTGMRRGELFNLQWKDVSLPEKKLLIQTPKSGKQVEICYFEDKARNALQEQLDLANSGSLPESPFVFPGWHGNKLTDIKRFWNRIRQAAGLPSDFRFHGLRHNYASQLAISGQVTPIQIKEALRHSSLKVTQRYIDLTEDSMRSVAEVFEKRS